MPISEIMINQTSPINIWQYAKILYITFFAIYLIFSLIVVRQIKLMVATIDGKLSPAIKIIGWINLGFSILILVLSLILL